MAIVNEDLPGEFHKRFPDGLEFPDDRISGEGEQHDRLRASDGRPDDPFVGQCPVDDVARKYPGSS